MKQDFVIHLSLEIANSTHPANCFGSGPAASFVLKTKGAAPTTAAGKLSVIEETKFGWVMTQQISQNSQCCDESQPTTTTKLKYCHFIERPE